jgi:hypothetical protein
MQKDILMSQIKLVLQNIVAAEEQKGTPAEEIIRKLATFDMDAYFIKAVQIKKKHLVGYFKDIMFERSILMQIETDEFLARHAQIWWKGFVASEALYSIVIEMAEQFGKYLEALKGEQKKDIDINHHKFLALRGLHARACQVYLEILTLVKNGFADGAFARWRTLFEISVIAQFIRQKENVVAEAYYEAANQDSGWHNWACVAECFQGKKKISFDMIWDQCEFISSTWEKQYQLAHKIIHASPQGTFKRMSIHKTSNIIPVGRSDYGIFIPATNAAFSLAYTTESFLSFHNYGDGLVNRFSLIDWIDIVQKAYDEAKETCFEKE